jgi:hypothetical protein
MSQDPAAEDTKRKLDDLEQRIKTARSTLGAHKEISREAHKDWDEMVQKHAQIRRKLEGSPTADVVEGARLDVDTLCNSFERWMARVESNFARKG